MLRPQSFPIVLLFSFFSTLYVLSGCATGTGTASPEGEAAAPRFTDAQLEDIREQAERFSSEGGGGVTVGIRSGDELVLLEGFGAARENEPLDPTTVLEVGSVTKQFTAALILLAQQEGKLLLDDELRTHLAGYPERGAGITIRHLLHHTSGIVSYTNIPEFAADGTREWTPEDLVALVSDRELEFAPGTGWNYSNSGYFLLGLILEGVYVDTYADILELKLFEPLGLDDTGYCDTDPTTVQRAQGHTANVASASVHMSQPGAAGAICSTATDLLQWSHALMEGEVVDTDLATPGTLDDGTPIPYSYGLFIGRSNWRATVAHGGNIPGFTARTARYPSTDAAPPLDIVLLSNRDGASLGTLEQSVVSTLLGAYEHVAPAAPLDAEAAAAFVGAYTATGLPPVTISFDGELRGVFGNSPPLALEQLAARDFSYPAGGLFLRFLATTPRSLEIEQGGILLFLSAAD